MDDLDRIIKMANIVEDASYEADVITDARNEATRSATQLNMLARRLVKGNHTASAASVLNCVANLQENIRLLDSATADISKQYDRPGGWGRFELDGE